MNKKYSDWFPRQRNTAGTNHKTADQATLLTSLVTASRSKNGSKLDVAVYAGNSAYPSFRGLVTRLQLFRALWCRGPHIIRVSSKYYSFRRGRVTCCASRHIFKNALAGSTFLV
jgi:hypothetical protein